MHTYKHNYTHKQVSSDNADNRTPVKASIFIITSINVAYLQTHACSRPVEELWESSENGRKATHGENMRVWGSCRIVAVCPVCVLLRAGTDTMKPAVLARVARACLVTERHAGRGGVPGVQKSRPVVRVDCCVTNVSLQRPSATGPLSWLTWA